MQQYIEEEIIKQLRDPAHQRDAFAQVVNFYGEKLYWQIRKMVLDHDDANDLLQNTFLKAWTNIDYFRGEAKLSTWLYKIAINECITFLNRLRMQNNVSIDDTDVFFAGVPERRRIFRRGCRTDETAESHPDIAGETASVFNMKYFDDMKYEDMSEIFGTSVGALKCFLSSCGEESRGVFNKRHLNLSCYHLSKEHKREMI